MNLSMKWLADYVKLDGVSAKDYCDRMTDTGSKVETFEVLSEKIDNVVVGKLISVEKHPDSDHLLICQVDVGTGEPVQIVTGAQNVKPGEFVPAALHKSLLPNGTVIKAGKLRGVPSNGMLCSIGELGLDEHDVPYQIEDGIWLIKEEDSTVGSDIKPLIGYDDTVVEFEITSNRPDCLSIIGLARETAVSFGKDFNAPAPVVKGCGDNDKIENYLSVEIKAPDLCPRYCARVVKNVKIGPSPRWLRERLRNCGVRPINNIVDITNYVMLEYGQPMHAFDYNYIKGGKITVRVADNGEKITTLDGIERELTDKMLVIADQQRAVAVAGVMGGENSEIQPDTKTIVFESANFFGPSVRITARDLGMRTEASGKYEKGLDAENCLPAIQRACELIELLGAGDVVDGIIDEYPTHAEIVRIPFDSAKINAFLGTDISEEFMLETLAKLDVKYENGMLIPPSYRADLIEMPDIAEEVVRIHGYNDIPSARFKGEAVSGGRTPKQQFLANLDSLLQHKGIHEVLTYSFISPKWYDKIGLSESDAKRNSIVISNPLGEDTSIMRTTALPGVMEALSTNRRYRNEKAAIYEKAKIYVPNGELADEVYTTVIASYGMFDFYEIKGICEEILDAAGIKGYETVSLTTNPTYHPGRCAQIVKDDTVLFTLGELHPQVSKNYGFDCPVYVAEGDTEAIFELRVADKEYTPLPKFPASTRDLAFVCDDELEAGVLKKAIKKLGGNLLESVEVFDVFKSDKLGEGKKSMAYSLVLRNKEKTISDDEADNVVNKILKGLEKDFGVTLRG